jgi:predicted transcriptional regulator
LQASHRAAEVSAGRRSLRESRQPARLIGVVAVQRACIPRFLHFRLRRLGGPPPLSKHSGNPCCAAIYDYLVFLEISRISGSTLMVELNQSSDLLTLTTEIVAAHVSNNTVSLGDLPQLINQVYSSLANIGAAPAPPAARPQPATSVKKSVQPDYIVCLEDGKKLKMLKRHLKTAYNMSPEAYRERWGLPPDYPMVAPNYARQRSRLAKEIGLGTRARRARA